jgi:chorismate dehydratase
VLLLSKYPATALDGHHVIVSRSSMTSVALLRLLFKHVWKCEPVFTPGDAEVGDLALFSVDNHAARLVIGDAALLLSASSQPAYRFRYDLGEQWKSWTGLPFVFAVWVAQRSTAYAKVLAAHEALLASRSWGLANLPTLASEAARVSGVSESFCREYLGGLEYSLSQPDLHGLSEFFRRLASEGLIAESELSFLPAA